MSEWKNAQLCELCVGIFDCPHTTAPDEGCGIPLIRTPNIGRGRLKLDGVHRVSEEVYLQRTKRAIPKEGDLIFAREAPAGNVAVITKGQMVCLGQRTVLIRPAPDKLDSAFLAYYMLAPEQQSQFGVMANGATVSHINIPDLKALKISYPPPLPTQRKIAAVLSALDDKIENNRKICANLEAQAQAIFKSWFVDFEPFGGKMPEGWKMGKLGDVIEFLLWRGSSCEEAIPLSCRLARRAAAEADEWRDRCRESEGGVMGALRPYFIFDTIHKL